MRQLLLVCSWLRARKERGQTLVEYAFIILLIAVMLVGALLLFMDVLLSAYSKITSSLVPPAYP